MGIVRLTACHFSLEVKILQFYSFMGLRGKNKDATRARRVQWKQCRALQCCVFSWLHVRPCNGSRSQESLIHRGLSGKEKASWTIPRSGSLWWNPAISQPWASEPPEGLGLRPVFSNGPAHRGGREREREKKRQATRGCSKRWQRCSEKNKITKGEKLTSKESAGGEKHTITQIHEKKRKEKRFRIGAFRAELQCW